MDSANVAENKIIESKMKKRNAKKQITNDLWTTALVAAGLVSMVSIARADEQMNPVQTALSQTTLSGYVDTAMQWNPGTDQNPNGGPNLPAYSYAKDDGFSLNAVDIALDRPEDSSQWAAGYHVEMMYGADSTGVSLSPGANATLRQAFIRLHTPVFGNGIDWQIGVFDQLIGFESSSMPLNPNYTHSYAWSIEPTTLTGIAGTYKVNDEISIEGDVANTVGGLGTIAPTFAGGSSYESERAYVGLLTLTAPSGSGFLKGATLTAGIEHGDYAPTGGQTGGTTSWYIGLTAPTPITQVKLGGSFDYVTEAGATGNNGDDLWDVAGYATFQATDKLSFNARAEYLVDSTAPGDIVNFYNTDRVVGGIETVSPGNAAEEFTLDVQYNLWANVMTRGEFRWDHVEHGDPFGASPNTGLPYKSSDFLLALNVIYQF